MRIFILFVLAVSAVAVAQTTQPVTSTTKHYRAIEAVEADYQERVNQLNREHERQVEAATKDRAKGLRQVLESAMDAKDLELANRADAAIKAGASPTTKPTRSTEEDAAVLRRALTGRRYMWGKSESFRFGDNGVVIQPNWDKRDLATSWTCIDRRTVLFRIERGRAQDVYAILLFSEGLDDYTSHSFDGTVHKGNKLIR